MPGPGSLSALFHDARLPHAPPAEIDWYAARLPRHAGPALAAMCGTGRVLAPLVAAGHNVHGVDVSAAMIAGCEARLAAAGLGTPLYRQDVAALNLPQRYAAIYVAEGAFQRLVDPAAARRALERFRAHLVPPGVLLLDLRVPAEALHPPGAPVVEVFTVTLPDGTRIGERAEMFVDADGRRIDRRSRLERRQGTAIVAREDETRALTWYDEAEIAALLAAAGWRDVAIEASPTPIVSDERRFAVRALA